MPQFIVRRWLVVASMLTVSCSLVLDWDQARLKCGADPNACLDNYSCLIVGNENHCVADHSLVVGETCSASAQCVPQATCSQSFIDRPCTNDASCNTCLTQCALADAYTQTGCSGTSFCEPYCNAALTSQGNATYATCSSTQQNGGCAPTASCVPNSNCLLPNSAAPGVCIAIGPAVNACLQACSFDWTKSPADNCTTHANSAFCTPVGMADNQQWVCIRIGTSAPVPPNASGCDAGANPCTPGYACIGGTCSQLCNLPTGACATGTCQQMTGLGPTPPGINVANTGYCR